MSWLQGASELSKGGASSTKQGKRKENHTHAFVSTQSVGERSHHSGKTEKDFDCEALRDTRKQTGAPVPTRWFSTASAGYG